MNDNTQLIDKAFYETLKISEDLSTIKLLNVLYYNLFNEWPPYISVLTKKKFIDINRSFNDHPTDELDDGPKIDYDNFTKKILSDGNWRFCSLDYDDIYVNYEKKVVMALFDTWVRVVHHDNDKELVKTIQRAIRPYEVDDDMLEIGILCQRNGGYFIEDSEIGIMDINVEQTYNDDIPVEEIDNFILKEQGLILFYGEPGTGKTTYIRHLMQKHRNVKFIVLDSNLLYNITSSSLLNVFISNRNAVYIIEDCEKLLVSRDDEPNAIISAFLNMTDGILANVINCKFVCTFNTDLDKIDDAIKRKGRMKLKYEFKKLNHNKVKQLTGDDVDMTIADAIYIQKENDFSKKKTNKIGFV